MSTEHIKLVVADVDGTLTDGGMYITESGDEFKRFNAKDGMGVKLLRQRGIETAIISASIPTRAIHRRAEMLKISRCYVGSGDKLEVLRGWCEELGIALSQVAFIGDDVNDAVIMKAVGFSACPADAVQAIKDTAQHTLQLKGGEGCFREMVDKYF